MKAINWCFLPFQITFILLTSLLMFPSVPLAQSSGELVGQAVSLQGTIEVRRVSQPMWRPVQAKETFIVGDTVRVGTKSRADIALINDTVIRLDQNTTITFSGPEREGFSMLELIKGAFYFLTNRPRTLKVATPFVNGVIEGTEFYVLADTDKTMMTVFKGHVALTNRSGTLTIREGQSAIAMADRPPEVYIGARPRDAVQWTLYYPPVLHCAPGEMQAALPSDHRALSCKASQLLAVGRVDEAQPDLDQALSRSPGYGPALAMKSIIALAQNKNSEAMDLAKKAVAADPQSASSWMALSYVQQGSFDLEGALKSIEQAVKAEPGNAFAMARLSDLWLSFGYLDKALIMALGAEKINPNISRTHTVLGFACLARIETKEAKTSFEKAITIDQADPLPRLGLGLAMIREGALEEGRKELEIAATLDPQNSIIRSYLGKAYYEEKREKHASEQYAMAKQFDPNDPTPYLYDAILKQSINRPVEALHDLERSIELNDQRAVYRSRLLLDEDIAVRQTNIARIYSELGFEQRALVEGWKSVNTDPANYSAHRFLADSYAALPRHEIARVSEHLQSQLLQPININPVQPSLGLVDNLIPGGLGFANPSFNEYSPLFNRNRFALLASGLVGENGTWGEEIVQSGLWGKFSYSLGQLHFETDGYRKNNDITRNIYNLFTQFQASPKTSLQLELRSSNLEKGDTWTNYFPNDFIPSIRQKEDGDSARFGLHHSFSPGSDVIASAAYGRNLNTIRLPTAGFFDRWKGDQKGLTLEAQYLFRRPIFNLVFGAGYSNIDETEKDIFIIYMDPDPPIRLYTKTKSNAEHTNMYVYSQITYPKNLIFTIGSGIDFLRADGTNRDQFNPKFGITWNPFPSTTFRAAAFRTFQRTLLAQQTIEPTQVAGFNQFFDSPVGTKAWRYGGAIDQKFTKDLYGGVEYSWRDLEFPGYIYTLDGETGSVMVTPKELKWKEKLGRAYLYWTPHPWFALTAEYLYEKFDNPHNINGPSELKTYRVPLGVGFFHPFGLTGKLKATYVNQRGEFRMQGMSPTDSSIPDTSRFWVVDASMSYRLPKRYGMITAGVNNLFNRSFRFHDMDIWNPRLQPDRFFFVKVTFAL